MNTPLITVDEIKVFKGISSNLNQAKDLIPHILEAQEFDLRPFIGESFYLAIEDDLLTSPALVEYSDLWNGSRYTHGGNEYEHKGLKAILIYHAYARFIAQGGIQSTPSGMVNKINPYSEKADPAAINRMVKQARSAASAHEDRVRCFLDRFSSSYPLWECTRGRVYKNGMKIKRIN